MAGRITGRWYEELYNLTEADWAVLREKWEAYKMESKTTVTLDHGVYVAMLNRMSLLESQILYRDSIIEKYAVSQADDGLTLSISREMYESMISRISSLEREIVALDEEKLKLAKNYTAKTKMFNPEVVEKILSEPVHTFRGDIPNLKTAADGEWGEKRKWAEYITPREN